MKSILALLFSIIITTSFAQTKLIAFKSHSGNMKNFDLALNNELFDNEGSNFGGPVPIRTYYLDSVIYISSSASVRIQKVYSRFNNEPKDSARFIRIEKDTLYNDPLFSKNHSLDSIKSVLKTSKQYDNNIKKAVFIGYDNKKTKGEKNKNNLDNIKEKAKENNILPIVPANSNTINNNTFDRQMIQALAMIFLLALLGGWLSWKIASRNSKKDKALLDKLSLT